MGWWERLVRVRARPVANPGGAAGSHDNDEWAAPPATVEEYRERLRLVGLAEHIETLTALARPSIRLEVDERAEAAVGGSRLGGVPDLPAETPWPEGDSGPLSFIAQINLADVPGVAPPGSGLPSEGLLSFFYDAVSQSAWGFDPADRDSWAVVFSNLTACQPRTPPDELPAEGRFGPVGLTYRLEMTFAPWESFEVDRIGIDRPGTNYARVLGTPDDVIHRLLGHPDPVQGDMQHECQLASNGVFCGNSGYTQDPTAQQLWPGSHQWRLLLQIDSSEDLTGMMWGDLGRIYYWIREEDLAARNWDATWLVLQCG